MAELASKFNVGCVIQYYSDQCSETDRNYDSCIALVQVIKITFMQIVSIKSFRLSMCVKCIPV